MGLGGMIGKEVVEEEVIMIGGEMEEAGFIKVLTVKLGLNVHLD
jgi:hypothetical protein